MQNKNEKVSVLSTHPKCKKRLASKSNRKSKKVLMQGLIDLIGFILHIGDIADGVNAGIYVLRGDYINASISVVAMVPAIEALQQELDQDRKLSK